MRTAHRRRGDRRRSGQAAPPRCGRRPAPGRLHPPRGEPVTVCHRFSPPRPTFKDAAAGVCRWFFRHFDGFSARFRRIFPGFSDILTAVKVRFFGLCFLFLPFFGPPARYWGGRFFHSRVRKPENFLGIGAFLHFPGGGSEKVRGDFFGKIFKMIHCDTLFRV